jgi:hypothetical protein
VGGVRTIWIRAEPQLGEARPEDPPDVPEVAEPPEVRESEEARDQVDLVAEFMADRVLRTPRPSASSMGRPRYGWESPTSRELARASNPRFRRVVPLDSWISAPFLRD